MRPGHPMREMQSQAWHQAPDTQSCDRLAGYWETHKNLFQHLDHVRDGFQHAQHPGRTVAISAYLPAPQDSPTKGQAKT